MNIHDDQCRQCPNPVERLRKIEALRRRRPGPHSEDVKLSGRRLLRQSLPVTKEMRIATIYADSKSIEPDSVPTFT